MSKTGWKYVNIPKEMHGKIIIVTENPQARASGLVSPKDVVVLALRNFFEQNEELLKKQKKS